MRKKNFFKSLGGKRKVHDARLVRSEGTDGLALKSTIRKTQSITKRWKEKEAGCKPSILLKQNRPSDAEAEAFRRAPWKVPPSRAAERLGRTAAGEEGFKEQAQRSERAC